jgi:tRNA(Ile)-lysidine synthase
LSRIFGCAHDFGWPAHSAWFWQHARMPPGITPPDVLIDSLRPALEHLPGGAIAVAFSGGMDSTVLLHALAQNEQVRARGLRAIHVDHRLHADSSRWTAHCCAFAQRLGVALDTVAVDVVRDAGTGLEDAARRARRAAFSSRLQHGEILALAHHRDDQAETILLKLLRGAGPEGLGGMRVLRHIDSDDPTMGYLWRPLLELPHAVLIRYAQSHALSWIEDPSNADTHLRRNFLRAQILPHLQQRWPQAQAALAHSATWARNAAELIDAQSITALAGVRGSDAATLDWRGWLELPEALRDPVLRRWLRSLRLDEPAHFHVVEIVRQLREAAPGSLPCVRWPDTEVRRYRDLLYAMRPMRAAESDWESPWDGTRLTLPTGHALLLAPLGGRTVAPVALRVRSRRGGERLKPAGRTHTRQLRALLQEAGVPPWLRAQIPLIYSADELIAAGDVFLSAAAVEMCERLGAGIVWERAAGSAALSHDTIDSSAPVR